MKNLQCKLTRKRWLEIGVSALLFVLIIAWALVLEYTEPDREATAARKRYFAVARVTDILDDNAETQDWTEGRRIGQQYLEVEILNGPWKGETLEAINYLTIYTNVDAKIGTKIVVRLDLDDEGAPYIISIPNYNRAPVLIGLLAVFAALLLLIGRKRASRPCWAFVYACVRLVHSGTHDPARRAAGRGHGRARRADDGGLPPVPERLQPQDALRHARLHRRRGGGRHFRRPVRVDLAAQRLQPAGGGGTGFARVRPGTEDQRSVRQRHSHRLARRGHGRGHVHFLRLLGAARAEPRPAAQGPVPLRHEHRPGRHGHHGEYAHPCLRRFEPQYAPAVPDL